MDCDFVVNYCFVEIKSCVSIRLSSLGVTVISDLKLATDLRLKLSYNCWEQILERSRLWSLGPTASANRVEVGKTPCE